MKSQNESLLGVELHLDRYRFEVNVDIYRFRTSFSIPEEEGFSESPGGILTQRKSWPRCERAVFGHAMMLCILFQYVQLSFTLRFKFRKVIPT